MGGKGLDTNVFTKYDKNKTLYNRSKTTFRSLTIRHGIHLAGAKSYTWELQTIHTCFLRKANDTIIHAQARCNETTSYMALVLEEL